MAKTASTAGVPEGVGLQFIRFPAARTSTAYAHFERTVLHPVPLRQIRRALSSEQYAELEQIAPHGRVSVWALALTKDGRNRRPWNAIKPGEDIAFFYTEKRFTHRAPVLYKWESDLLQNLVKWGPRPDGARYSLAVALGNVERCDFGGNEYAALCNYKKIPMHSDFHSEDDSRELFEALRMGFQLHRPDEHEVISDISSFDSEGDLRRYRIQAVRERSEANRLRVIEKKGHVCEVCEFDFAKQYGDGFRPSAHVHHNNPIALGERRAKDYTEFSVLCAPCHTAAHMGPGRLLHPWTVSELRTRIRTPWAL
jgi:hypothetical protein